MTKLVPLEKIVKVIRNGMNAEQLDTQADGAYPISRIETISAGTIDLSRVKYSTVTEAEKKKYALQSGDILFSHINSPTHIGKTALFRKNLTLIHGINLLLIRVDQQQCHPEYLNYYFKSYDVRALFRARCKKAVNQASLNQGDILELEVPLPPLPEQKRIAAQLAQADRLRQLRRNASRLGESYLQSAFLAMFGDPIKNEKGWEEARFDKICKIDAEMVDPKKDEYKKFFHIGSANIESVTGRVLDLHTAEKDGLISGNFLITPEHILFSKIRPKLCKVAYPQIHGLCSADIYPIRVTSPKCNTMYLLQWLRSPEFTEIVASRAEARAQIPKVNRTELSQISIPLPPLPEQERFAQIVARYERLRSQMRESTRQAELLFQGLLHESFGN